MRVSRTLRQLIIPTLGVLAIAGVAAAMATAAQPVTNERNAATVTADNSPAPSVSPQSTPQVQVTVNGQRVPVKHNGITHASTNNSQTTVTNTGEGNGTITTQTKVTGNGSVSVTTQSSSSTNVNTTTVDSTSDITQVVEQNITNGQ